MIKNGNKCRAKSLMFAVLCSIVFTGCTSESIESIGVAGVIEKYKGDEIPAVLLTNDGMNIVKDSSYINHLEFSRLASINKGLPQQSRVVPDDLFLGFNVTLGSRVSSRTGQVFSYYHVHGVDLDDTESRLTLISKVQPYGGWCYVSEDDALVCDIPMIVTKA
jgi:hypothetical protein